MIAKIDHIGIAVSSLEERLAFWAQALGLQVGGIEEVGSEKVRVALLPAGESRIELLEPTDPDSAIARHLTKRGEGIQHIAFEVTDIDAAVAQLERMGVTFIGDAPRPGAEGRQVAFIHPKAAGGVLLELTQSAAAPAEQAAENSIGAGSTVLLYLREPQEKLWGVLRSLDPSGVVMEGIDLASFDDWVAQIEREEENVVGASLLFMPMARIEKIMLDRSSGDLPSLAERFERRTGMTVQEVLGSDV
jgi:methylmalonyl-CoA/ethylmalonyl-CoA epimerase